MTRRQRVDPKFEDSVNEMRVKISKDLGIDVTFVQATKMVSKMMRGMDVSFQGREIPKSKLREVKMMIRKKKR